jgi:cell division septation protein DedD
MTNFVRPLRGALSAAKPPLPRHLGWRHATGLVAALFVVIAPIATAQAASSVPLGSDSTFAVLAGSAISNTGVTTIVGDVGIDPGVASQITGFGSATVTGSTYAADSVAQQAQTDLTTAYNDASAQPSTTTVTTGLGGGSTLTPGVYTAASSLGVGGTLTLDGQGNANSVFIFQAGTTLLAAGATTVLLVNGASACNVVWEVGTAATIGAGSTFVGTIMAATGITINLGASVNGRVLNETGGAVTLDGNQITSPTCTTPPVVSPTPVATTPVTTTPVTTTPVATTPVASAPSATDTAADTVTGRAVTVALRGSDPTGSPLTYTITSRASHGSLGAIDQAGGSVVYTPSPGYTGPDSFSYEVTSKNGTSATATVTIKTMPSAALLRARAKAKAEAKAKAKARARAKANGHSRLPVKKPAFTG